MAKYKTNGYTDKQVEYILKHGRSGIYTWDELAEKFNKKFKPFIERTGNALRKTYDRYGDFELSEDELISNIRKAHRTRKAKARLSKEHKSLLDNLDFKDDLLEEIDKIVKKHKRKKIKVPKLRRDRKKRNMTKELMLTDNHIGKLTDKFNAKVAAERYEKLTSVFLSEVERYGKNYNVERAIIFLGGDIMESSTMHGEESLAGSEFGNMEQMRVAVDLLLEKVIIPIASTGMKVTIPAVAGNHDRIDQRKTYNKPGKEYMTWVVYNMLKKLCDVYGFKNVEFIIPEGVYCVVDIYGSKCLYEHGDHHGHTEKAIETHIANRSKQTNELIDFYRFGHLHTYMMIGRGRIIRNGSLPGNDGYSKIHGFNSEATQTINSYIETKTRPTPFYKSFPVCLED